MLYGRAAAKPGRVASRSARDKLARRETCPQGQSRDCCTPVTHGQQRWGEGNTRFARARKHTCNIVCVCVGDCDTAKFHSLHLCIVITLCHQIQILCLCGDTVDACLCASVCVCVCERERERERERESEVDSEPLS
jgi:hypothetical protein